MAADAPKMNDARTSVIGAGAAAVAGALWAPWYALNFGPQAKGAIGAQTDKLPGAVGDFTRQLLSLIPTRIEATAWQAFEKADVVLLVCAMVAVAAALLGRMDVVGLAGGGAAVVTVVSMVDRPLPPEILTLEWGPWLSLGGRRRDPRRLAHAIRAAGRRDDATARLDAAGGADRRPDAVVSAVLSRDRARGCPDPPPRCGCFRRRRRERVASCQPTRQGQPRGRARCARAPRHLLD